MSYKVLSKCPVCSGKLKAVKLKCDKCNTVIENSFEFSKYEYLDEEYLNFIEVFLKCRGNIKDVEKELGISYPTVRGKLDAVIRSLGFEVNTKEAAVEAGEREAKAAAKNDILEKLSNGEITAKEATEQIKNL